MGQSHRCMNEALQALLAAEVIRGEYDAVRLPDLEKPRHEGRSA